jgi:hypothetical protein
MSFAPYATFLWAGVFALFAKIGGATEGIQVGCGLIAIAVCLIIAEVAP